MHRTLLVERPVRGDAEALRRALRGDPAAWLPDLNHPGGDPATWQVYLWAGQIGGLVELKLDGWSGPGPTVSRRIRWDAGRWLGLRMIPSFDSAEMWSSAGLTLMEAPRRVAGQGRTSLPSRDLGG